MKSDTLSVLPCFVYCYPCDGAIGHFEMFDEMFDEIFGSFDQPSIEHRKVYVVLNFNVQ